MFALFVGLIYACVYVYSVHMHRETDLWWSHLTVTEKEISYRTEQGLYQLSKDNKTEAPGFINIYKRMNIIPEVILAVFYWLSPWRKPIDFYDLAVTALQAFTLIGLVLTAWEMTNLWVSCPLYASLFLLNQHEMSRVAFTLPLRENFSLPFWWLRMFFATQLMKGKIHLKLLSFNQYVQIFLLWFTTAAFCMTWQFGQFALLIETSILAVLHHANVIHHEQCLIFSFAGLFGLICTSLSQAGNLFPFASPCCALLLTNLLWMNFRRWAQRCAKSWHGSNVCSRLLIRVVSLPPYNFLYLWPSMNFRHLSSKRVLAIGPVLMKIGIFGALFSFSRYFISSDDASHIVSFVRHKLNWRPKFDFHTALYLCSGAFQSMDILSYLREGMQFSSCITPAYCVGLLSLGQLDRIRLVQRIKKLVYKRFKWNHKPGNPLKSNNASTLQHLEAWKLWHLANTLLFGLLAWSTTRMKYLWTPHLLLVATYGLITVIRQCCAFTASLSTTVNFRSQLSEKRNSKGGSPDVSKGSKQRDSNGFRLCPSEDKGERRQRLMLNTLLILVTLGVNLKVALQLRARLNDLREFYDPDTVDLMNWISTHTNPDAIFTGSMQLMAGVKLCTGRAIANHPHYEDARLREKTRRLYQIYGRRNPVDIHRLLLNHSITHIIIENSICFAPSTGCAERDLVDLDNREWPDLWLAKPELVKTRTISDSYHLDEETWSALQQPNQAAVRLCSELTQLSAHHSENYPTLQQRRLSRLFTLVYENPTFYIFKVNFVA
ncbi:hypothetical protein X801_05889 [Opisthorchis viverrini]|uniref:Uncharacterized protein n=1 Tax=Opisthorchis viverrini TaxID=6198 RepID=A0A1S8WUQ4_OPIVI|nr:hypothetical protein X801_05889 [Opisthorchis viverrini]